MEKIQTATFAAGCFWCTEAVMKQLRGVLVVISGYTGETTDNPTDYRIHEGTTGHAEAVQVTFDPSIVSYEQLLEVFFLMHDPTSLNRQMYDVGTQYRSAIFYENEGQRLAAEKVKKRLEEDQVFARPIVTEIDPLKKFYPAESYHQDYFARNLQQPYCRIIISPKLEKLRQKFSQLLKT